MMKRASDQPSPPLKHVKRDPSPPAAPKLALLKAILKSIDGINTQKPSKDTLSNVYHAVALSIDPRTDSTFVLKDKYIDKAQVEGPSFFDVLKRAAREDASDNDLEALTNHSMWHFYYVMNRFMNDFQAYFGRALDTSVRLFNLPIACSRSVMLFSHR
jgi:hypothetical protein